jgi:hypothetical protein
MPESNISDKEIAELVQRTADAASAYIRGDMRRYLSLIKHADDYTLLPPLGGDARRVFDASSQAIEATERDFKS